MSYENEVCENTPVIYVGKNMGEEKIYQRVIDTIYGRLYPAPDAPRITYGEQRISYQLCELLDVLLKSKEKRSISVDHKEVFLDKINEMKSNQQREGNKKGDYWAATQYAKSYCNSNQELPASLLKMSELIETYMYKCLGSIAKKIEGTNNKKQVKYVVEKINPNTCSLEKPQFVVGTPEEQIYQRVINTICDRLAPAPGAPRITYGEQRISCQQCELLDALIKSKEKRSIAVDHKEVFLDKINEKASNMQQEANRKGFYWAATQYVKSYCHNDEELPASLLEMSELLEIYMYKCLGARAKKIEGINNKKQVKYIIERIEPNIYKPIICYLEKPQFVEDTPEEQIYQKVIDTICDRLYPAPDAPRVSYGEQRVSGQLCELLDILLRSKEKRSIPVNHKEVFLNKINEMTSTKLHESKRKGDYWAAAQYAEKYCYNDEAMPPIILEMSSLVEEYVYKCLGSRAKKIKCDEWKIKNIKENNNSAEAFTITTAIISSINKRFKYINKNDI